MTSSATAPPVANPKAKKPVCRKASYHRVNPVFGSLELTIGDGEKAKTYGYWVEDLACQFGPTFRAFNLLKYEHQRSETEPNSYDVLIDAGPAAPGRPQHQCECLGFLRWQKPCKHISSLLALVHEGKI